MEKASKNVHFTYLVINILQTWTLNTRPADVRWLLRWQWRLIACMLLLRLRSVMMRQVLRIHRYTTLSSYIKQTWITPHTSCTEEITAISWVTYYLLIFSSFITNNDIFLTENQTLSDAARVTIIEWRCHHSTVSATVHLVNADNSQPLEQDQLAHLICHHPQLLLLRQSLYHPTEYRRQPGWLRCTVHIAQSPITVPNQVQAGTGDVHDPHTSVPRLPGRFCTPLQQQWSGTLSGPLDDRHQLLCSTYEDEIQRQSFLCGRASRVEQFASGSLSRGQFTLFKRRLKSYFFSLCFNDWQCNALQVRFCACRALNSRFYSILLTNSAVQHSVPLSSSTVCNAHSNYQLRSFIPSFDCQQQKQINLSRGLL